MQQGLEQLLRLAFTTLGLHRLEANIQPDNARSKALVESCGLTLKPDQPEFLYITVNGETTNAGLSMLTALPYDHDRIL